MFCHSHCTEIRLRLGKAYATLGHRIGITWLVMAKGWLVMVKAWLVIAKECVVKAKAWFSVYWSPALLPISAGEGQLFLVGENPM